MPGAGIMSGAPQPSGCWTAPPGRVYTFSCGTLKKATTSAGWGFVMKLLLTIAPLCLLAIPAEAALVDRGGGLIYDSDRNITWLANANAGAGSAFDDGFLDSDGAMTWQSAVNWAAALSYYDNVRDVTWTDWRLATTTQPDASCSQQEGGGSFSAGANCTGSELGHLFYEELGGTAMSSVLSSSDGDLALFTNIQADGYWSQQSYDTTFAWVFNLGYGLQAADQKTLGYFAWAVRDGDVAAVPAPATVPLLATALLLAAGRARRRRR